MVAVACPHYSPDEILIVSILVPNKSEIRIQDFKDGIGYHLILNEGDRASIFGAGFALRCFQRLSFGA